MDNFKVEDLFKIYAKYKKQYGKDAYRYVSSILKEAKPKHKKF